MNEIGIYFKLGLEHITDFEGYDHMLFIITLCAVYRLRQWKQLLILVTAFTLGHSLTLALTSLNIIKVNGDIIELLIPITIILTAFYNLFHKEKATGKVAYNYLLALGFGLIHGMGFANYFKALLGSMGSVVKPLFFFNLGIEIGQLFIVAGFMLVLYFFEKVVKVKHREWILFWSGVGAGMGLMLFLNVWNG